MNITKNVITDLFPLYAEHECSTDTQALVEEYLRRNPGEAEELRRVFRATLPGKELTPADLHETKALRTARRILRWRSWVLAIAIFLSLTPFSVIYTGEKTYWLLRDAPASALVYGVLALGCWTGYLLLRRNSRGL